MWKRSLLLRSRWNSGVRFRWLPSPRGIAPPRRQFATEVSAAELQFGQPVHETHPHILRPGECMRNSIMSSMNTADWKLVTPGITAQEYAQRRSRLANRLPKNAIAVLAAAEVKYKAPGIFYEYHQDPDFFYLTGRGSNLRGKCNGC